MGKIRKALVAGVLAGVTALTPLLSGTGQVTRDSLLAVLAAALTATLVYLTPNHPA